MMLASIDDYLVANAPSWYRTPTIQTCALGFVFFWVFAAYTTIQFYSASVYGPTLAADCVSSIYLAFTLACLISPGVVNKCGCRLSMFFGILGYASLVLVSLIYFLFGGHNIIWARRLVVMGGVFVGCGASLLWTAQGRLILQYASRAGRLEACGGGLQNDGGTNRTGKLMGLFWAIFQCSSLVGGGISFIYYNQKPKGSTSLYLLFLGFIIIGALSSQLLLPPSMLENVPNKNESQSLKDFEMVTDQTPLTSDSGAEYERGELPTTGNRRKMSEELSDQSWWQEASGTLNMVFSERILYMSLLFVYTGFNQPYQQATFGNRFFTRRTIGVELIIFHLMEIVGAIVSGRFLDRESDAPDTSLKRRAALCLLTFIAVNGLGNFLAAMQEFNVNQSGTSIAHDITDPCVILPSISFACWGFADAQIQVYCYWLVGQFYTSGDDHSRAVGWYKCAQSLGTSVGFYLIPSSRLRPMSQLVLSSSVFFVGTALAFCQLPA
ncbi:hypothetical protein ACHAWF_002514 [Thalassiosira exigua]